MPEPTNTRVTSAYLTGYLDALRMAALDAKARGDIGQEHGPSVNHYLTTRADLYERDGIPIKDQT